MNVWKALGNSGRVPSDEFAAVGGGSRTNSGFPDEIDEMVLEFEDMGTSLCEIEAPGEISWEALTPMPTFKTFANGQQYSLEARQVRDRRRTVFPPRDSHGYVFFHRPYQRWPWSPLIGADWKVLRRLGFGIWSDRRMKQLGLKSRDRPLQAPYPDLAKLYPPEPPDQDGEEMGSREVVFTWNVLYRTAAGEDIRTSKAEMWRGDDAE